MAYHTGGQETPGRIEKGKVDTGLDIRPIPAGATLSQMLADGEIDALYTPRVPSPFRDRDPRVARLFDDVVAVEKEYFAATGIFPIMHVVVIRRDVYERHRWVAQSLYKACQTARDDAYARIYDSSALRFMEPWLIQHLEESQTATGPGLLVVRPGGEREGAGRVPALSPRAGAVPKAVRACRPVRRRDVGSIRHLTARVPFARK